MKLLLILIALTALLSSYANATTNDDAEALNITSRPAKLSQQIEQALIARGVDYLPRTEHLQADGSPVFTNRLILEDSPYLE